MRIDKKNIYNKISKNFNNINILNELSFQNKKEKLNVQITTNLIILLMYFFLLKRNLISMTLIISK